MPPPSSRSVAQGCNFSPPYDLALSSRESRTWPHTSVHQLWSLDLWGPAARTQDLNQFHQQLTLALELAHQCVHTILTHLGSCTHKQAKVHNSETLKGPATRKPKTQLCLSVNWQQLWGQSYPQWVGTSPQEILDPGTTPSRPNTHCGSHRQDIQLR